MTPAGQAIIDEIRRIEAEQGETSDGTLAKELFGDEPWNDPGMQEFIQTGYGFAANDFQSSIAVAVSWFYLGYRAAQNEVKQ